MKNKLNLIFLLVASVLISCGGNNDSKESKAKEDPVKDVKEILEAKDRSEFIGRRVEIETVVVQEVRGDVLFLAGPNISNTLPMSDTAELRGLPNPSIKVGQTLRITGTVGDLTQPENPSKFWRLVDEQERARIMASRVYISAEQITIVQGRLP